MVALCWEQVSFHGQYCVRWGFLRFKGKQNWMSRNLCWWLSRKKNSLSSEHLAFLLSWCLIWSHMYSENETGDAQWLSLWLCAPSLFPNSLALLTKDVSSRTRNTDVQELEKIASPYEGTISLSIYIYIYIQENKWNIINKEIFTAYVT